MSHFLVLKKRKIHLQLNLEVQKSQVIVCGRISGLLASAGTTLEFYILQLKDDDFNIIIDRDWRSPDHRPSYRIDG
jgi:hypothetical protein